MRLSHVGRGVLTVAGLLLVLVLTFAAFRLPIGDSLRLLAEGAFEGKFALARTALKSTPLLLTGLGMVVAWRAGMFNIGGEGQFVVGGLAGAAVAKAILRHAPGTAPALVVPALLIACVAGGAFWAWLAGWLYVRRGVEVVIGTILLNFVAFELLDYAVSGPLQETRRQLPMTDQLPDPMMLTKFDRQSDLHAGVILAVAMAALVYVYLFLTKDGYRLRLVGSNPRVARAYAIDPAKAQIRAMLLSGALCGLAGGVEYMGISGQIGGGFSQQWGFLGIPVALLGALHPLLAVISALIFGALFAGSENLARFTPAGTTIIYVVQAVAVLGFVGLQALAAKRKIKAEVG